MFAALAKQPQIFASANYPGVCDSAVPAGVGNSSQVNNDKYTDVLYNFSVSHKFSDDVMVYATTGSSFRTGLPAINNPGLPADLVTPKPERAKSYELGIKTSWGRALNVNASVFQIDYQNQLTAFEGVNYWNTISNRVGKTSLAFYRNVDARVRGFDLEIAARPADGLTLAANLSYSQIKSKGGNLPCNNAAVAITAANPINFCASTPGQVLNQQAPFAATVSGAYTVPVGPVDGYVRFNVSYQGKNPNYGNFASGSSFKSTPAYAVVDLFAGIAGEKGIWDLGFFAKNVFDKQVELSRITPLNNIYGPYAAAAGGYDQVRTSAPREIGVTLRYAFGSR